MDVALHLGQRDRAFGETSIGVKDRVLGILPALVGEAPLGCAVILDETITVRIAGAIDPCERRFELGPQLGQCRIIARPLDVEPGEDHE